MLSTILSDNCAAVVSNIYVKSVIKVTPDDTELSGKDGHNGSRK